MTPEVTKPQAIKPLTEDVTLPARPDGTQFVFRVRALVGAGIIAAQEAATIMTGQRSRSRPTPEQIADLDRSFRRIAQAGIVEPKLTFDGEGSPNWDDLTVGEQSAIVLAIYRLSGVNQSPEKEVAGKAARFPTQSGRRKKNGAAARTRVQAGGATERPAGAQTH